MAQPTKVPIVTYHSVADRHDHLFGRLSLPVSLFERQLRYLKRKGFQTVTLYDVYNFLRHGASLPERAMALTFDDGYLDNWVHAFPLLKKYAMKATIFVATDFVDPCNECRPTLDDVDAGRIDRRRLTWWGHLSWAELKAMLASGLVDVQSHTRTHTWSFVSDRIVDFHHPGDEYFWLDWNQHPDRKHSWLTRDFRTAVRWGTPVYEFAPCLLAKRYIEDSDVAWRAAEHVAARGGAAFFEQPAWRNELHAVVGDLGRGSKGRYETDAEHIERLRDELAGSKQILEQQLGKPVDFVCWPCGDYTASLQRVATEDCGYLASVNVAKVANRPGDDATELRRIVFGQDYMGPLQSRLIFMNFCGNVRYQSGVTGAYPIAPIARRLMRVGELLWPPTHPTARARPAAAPPITTEAQESRS